MLGPKPGAPMQTRASSSDERDAFRGEEIGHTDVLLVHGIWNTAHWLLPLARRMRAYGLAR